MNTFQETVDFGDMEVTLNHTQRKASLYDKASCIANTITFDALIVEARAFGLTLTASSSTADLATAAYRVLLTRRQRAHGLPLTFAPQSRTGGAVE